MIAPVGKWILEETMRKGKEILKYQPDFRLSVNVSYLQIMDQKFFPFLEDTMERFQIPAENLLIELTETHLTRCRSIFSALSGSASRSGYGLLWTILEVPTRAAASSAVSG